MSSLKITRAVFYAHIPIGGSRQTSNKGYIDLKEKGYEDWKMTYSNQCLEIIAPDRETFLVPSVGIKFMKAELEETLSKTDRPVSNSKGTSSKTKAKG